MGFRMFAATVVTMAAVAASAASASAAEPAFFECAKLKGGAFSDKLCSMPSGGSGKFELSEGIAGKKAFSAKASSMTVSTETLEMECSHVRMSGEVAGLDTVAHVSLTLEACSSGPGYCGATVGHHKGVIEFGSMDGSLGYIERAGAQVGLELALESGSTIAEFGCNATDAPEYRLQGGLLGELSKDVNVVSKTFGLVETGLGSFEGGEPVRLEALPVEGGAPEPVTLHATGGFKGKSGAWEIKA